tara:strand:- start:99 stop:725 length:627 start_codon:yes stop_codon:yes gene_type:complete
MATYDLAFTTRLDGYAIMQTFVDTDIQVTDSVVIAGAITGFSGTQTVLSTEPYLFLGVDDYGDFLFDYSEIMENQFIYKNAGSDYTRTIATGTVAFSPTCTWISNSDVLSWLGIDTATSNDTDFVTTCVSASNAWTYRKRREAGYTDSLSVVPGGDIKLGAICYAAMQYRSRGAVDGYASFDSMGLSAPSMTLGQILGLIGCGRPQVG